MSPWEQKAAQLDVEYVAWTPPNHGPADRAHFNYQGFMDDASAIEAEATALRDQVGVKAYSSATTKETLENTDTSRTERQDKLEKASDFLANIDKIIPLAS